MATSAEVAVYSTDPELRDHLEWIRQLPETDPAKHDCLAFVHMALARAAWRRADELRASARDHEKRSAAAKRGRKTPEDADDR